MQENEYIRRTTYLQALFHLLYPNKPGGAGWDSFLKEQGCPTQDSGGFFDDLTWPMLLNLERVLVLRAKETYNRHHELYEAAKHQTQAKEPEMA